MNKILCKKEKAGWDGKRKKIRKKRFKDIYSSGGWGRIEMSSKYQNKKEKTFPV